MNISPYQIFLFVIALAFSLILSVQDIKKMAVSIYIQWIAIFFALACHLIFAREGMWLYILSSMFCGAFYFAVRKITRGKLGLADVCFGFFQGLFLVPKLLPLCFGIECLAVLCIINRKIGKEKFPFIPFMSAGLIAAFIIQVVLIK